jgi:4-coumarate--CoA ligase
MTGDGATAASHDSAPAGSAMSLPAFVLRRARELGAHTAIIDAADGRRVSYGEFERRVRELAGGLRARGFQRGDVLAVLAPNSAEYAILVHGVWFAGGVVTTLNPAYTEREVRDQLRDAGASWLVTVPALLETARAASHGTAVTRLAAIGGGAGVTALEEWFGEPLADADAADPDAVAALLYSSGTTGVSKGVMLTHRALVENLRQTDAMLHYSASDVVIAVLPFFHCYGLQVILNTSLAFGATVVTLPRFELQTFLEAHQRYRVTMSFVAPPIMVALAKHPALGDFDLSSLRFMMSAAAPLSAELGTEVAARIGCRVVQGYGMTELGPVSHVDRLDSSRPGSVGVPVPDTENRIVDVESGEALGPGQEGELWVRSPAAMLGYLNNPAATAATLDADGWLHTGDIARRDADGYVYIVDRLKELIKVKGFQVAPAELEALLLTHPAVADAAVIGVPDERAGELPMAFVVRKSGATADANAIAEHVASRTAHFKRLARIEFVDAVPKSPSGKILRRLLRERVRSAH